MFTDPATERQVKRVKEWTVPTTILEAELRRQNASALSNQLTVVFYP